MKGLIVKSPWIDKILSGEKTWEIRGSKTKVRGRVCLIESGTGEIKGTVEIVDSQIVDAFDLKFYQNKHCIKDISLIRYKKPRGWIMANPERLQKPIPYKHPQGAVIWVNLPDDILEPATTNPT